MAVGAKTKPRDFPGGPVVETLPANTGDVGLIPGQGAKIPTCLMTAPPPQKKGRTKSLKSLGDLRLPHCAVGHSFFPIMVQILAQQLCLGNPVTTPALTLISHKAPRSPLHQGFPLRYITHKEWCRKGHKGDKEGSCPPPKYNPHVWGGENS